MTRPEPTPAGVPNGVPTHGPTHGPTDPVRAERPLRAHALRNRERLLAAARAAFGGAGETVALESIARDAGVGIGTLYRHFPTREVLVEAVYAAELDALASSAPALLDEFPADVALRVWMDGYAQFVATKRGMIDTLRAGWASGRITTPVTRERLTAAIEMIITAGAGAGTLRPEVLPEDVIALLFGVFLSRASAGNGPSDQTGRLLDLIVDALRPKA